MVFNRDANHETDFYSLLKFLRFTPFKTLRAFKIWMNSNKKSGRKLLTSALRPLLLRRTKEELKERGELDLLDKKLEVVQFNMNKEEMKLYSKISTMSKTMVGQFVAQKSTHHQADNRLLSDLKRNSIEPLRLDASGGKVEMSDIITQIIRLRQICNHPGLICEVSNILHSISLQIAKYYSSNHLITI